MLASPRTFASRPWPDPLDRGLVGEWRFDQDTGLLLPDYSGSTNHGSLINTPTWVASEVGPAVSFLKASSQYVNIPYSSVFSRVIANNRLTVEALCLVTSLTADQRAVSCWELGTSIFILWMDTDDGADGWAFAVRAAAGTQIAGGTVASAIQDQWQHVIGTWDGVSARIYVDGILRDTSAPAAGSFDENWSGDLAIGRIETGQYYDGSVALTRVLSRVLSAAEVQKRSEIVRQRRMQIGAPHLWRVLWGGAVAAPPAGIVVLRRRRM